MRSSILARLTLLGLTFFSCCPAVAAEPNPLAKPLAARSAASGGKLFSRLPVEETGISFVNRYDDPAMWGDRFHESAFGSIATGVAAGDFDGDGLPDLYFVSKVGPNHLYRNLGNLRFEDVTERAGVRGYKAAGGWGSGAVFADFNNDGLLDLYVTNQASPNELFINQGNGTFSEAAQATGVALLSGSSTACPMDFDRDGQLDLFVATNRLDHRLRAGEPDVLFRNRGDGTFEDVSAPAGLKGSHQTFIGMWWDFNQDGWPDLHTANDFEGPDQLYHNNRDGTFTDVADDVYPVRPYYAMGADTADVDNNGQIDLFVADMYATTHSRYLKNLAELPDLADAQDIRKGPQQPRNMLYINRGVGRMLEAARLAGLHATGWTWSVLFGDLDNDGWQDLHVTNGIFRDFMDSDIVMQLGRTREPSSRVWQRQPEAPERNLVFRNRGNLTFDDASADWGLDELGVGFGAVLVDLDRDGDLDVVVNNYNGEPSTFRNNSQTGAGLLVSLRGRESNRFGIGARVSVQAGSQRLVRELLSARGIVSGAVPELHFGLGSATRIDELVVDWPSGRQQTFKGLPVNVELKIDEEGALAVSVAQPAEPRWHETGETVGFPPVSLARNASLVELKRQPLLPWRLNSLPGSLAWADVNRDGRPDCFVGGVGGAPGHLAIASGEPGHFRLQDGPWTQDTEAYDAVVLWNDVNGDGYQDLLLVSGGAEYEAGASNYRPRLYLNNGHGDFIRAATDAMPDLGVSAGAAVFFKREGASYLFIGGRHTPGRYPESPRSYLLENRNGQFVDITDAAAPVLRAVGMVTGAVAGDDRSELFITVEWGTPRLFRHGPNGWYDASAAELPANLEGLWQCVATADLNGDGRPDFILGNFGLNTRYHGTPQQPTLLLAGDLAGEGGHNLLDLTFDREVIRPWRGMTELSRGLGSRRFAMRLLQRLPTFEAYSQAAIEDIFPPLVLSKAALLPAAELSSGVLLSGPRGYAFSPLPIEAQLAPLMGAAAGDVDGDGLADVVVTQGFSGPVPQFGRLQGGYGFVLKGDGRGGLTVLDPAKTGFLAPGDGRAATIIDCNGDGQPDIAVARNNARPLLFLSRRATTSP